jgi:hypothetical protein
VASAAVVVLRDTLARVALEPVFTPQAALALAVVPAAAPVIPFAFHVSAVATMVALPAEVLVY